MEVGQSQLVYHFTVVGDSEEMIGTIGIDPAIDSTGDLLSWATLGYDYFGTTILGFLSENVSLVGCSGEHREVGGVLSVRYNDVSAGLVSGGAVPQNTSFLLRKFTGFVGRGRTGRMFIPGVPEASVQSNGQVETSALSNLNTAAGDYYDLFPTGFLKVNHGATNGGGNTLIHTLAFDAAVATQRRRLRR